MYRTHIHLVTGFNGDLFSFKMPAQVSIMHWTGICVALSVRDRNLSQEDADHLVWLQRNVMGHPATCCTASDPAPLAHGHVGYING